MPGVGIYDGRTGSLRVLVSPTVDHRPDCFPLEAVSFVGLSPSPDARLIAMQVPGGIRLTPTDRWRPSMLPAALPGNRGVFLGLPTGVQWSADSRVLVADRWSDESVQACGVHLVRWRLKDTWAIAHCFDLPFPGGRLRLTHVIDDTHVLLDEAGVSENYATVDGGASEVDLVAEPTTAATIQAALERRASVSVYMATLTEPPTLRRIASFPLPDGSAIVSQAVSPDGAWVAWLLRRTGHRSAASWLFGMLLPFARRDTDRWFQISVSHIDGTAWRECGALPDDERPGTPGAPRYVGALRWMPDCDAVSFVYDGAIRTLALPSTVRPR